MDYYLKANTESELWSTLLSAGVAEEFSIKDSEGNVVETKFKVKNEYSLNIIGSIQKPTKNMVLRKVPDSDTEVEVPELETVEGFHANLRGPGNLGSTTTYVNYTPTDEERLDPNFVLPPPTIQVTPGPLDSILVKPQPKTPHFVWF